MTALALGLIRPSAAAMLAGGRPIAPTLDLGFARGVYKGAALSDLSVTRASSGMAQKADGSWLSFEANVPRITDKGLLVEEARTNYVGNNTMQGAAAPTSMPTGWALQQGGTTRTVHGVVMVDGVECLDTSFAGTLNGPIYFDMHSREGMPVAAGEAWTGSVFYQCLNDEPAIKGTVIRIYAFDANNTVLGTVLKSIHEDRMTFKRHEITYPSLPANVAKLQLRIYVDVEVGATVTNHRWLVGLPQLEKGAFATSPIRTTGAAATRAADNIFVSTEPQRTNYVRNNTMQGAVAGAPGIAPTHWNINPVAGVTRQIVGTGVENGVEYIDVRYSGTMGAGDQGLWFEAAGVPATVGQAWTYSVYMSLIAGSLTGFQTMFVLLETRADGSSLNFSTMGQPITVGGGALSSARIERTGTIARNEAAFIRPYFLFRAPTGTVVDFTVRIGLPQLEQGATATSPIRTSGSAVTRAGVDGDWYNGRELSFFAEILPVTPTPTLSEVYAGFGNGASFSKSIYLSRGTTKNIAFAPEAAEAFVNIQGPLVEAGSIVKSAIAIANGSGGAGSHNGSLVSDANAAIPTGITMMVLGRASWGPGNYANGYIRRVAYFPKRLPNEQLRALTA